MPPFKCLKIPTYWYLLKGFFSLSSISKFFSPTKVNPMASDNSPPFNDSELKHAQIRQIVAEEKRTIAETTYIKRKWIKDVAIGVVSIITTVAAVYAIHNYISESIIKSKQENIDRLTTQKSEIEQQLLLLSKKTDSVTSQVNERETELLQIKNEYELIKAKSAEVVDTLTKEIRMLRDRNQITQEQYEQARLQLQMANQRLSERDNQHDRQYLPSSSETGQSAGAFTLPNQNYILSVISYQTSSSAFNKIVQELERAGFRLHEKLQLDERQYWLATEPTVFYYRKETIAKAEEVANLLYQTIGVEFKVTRGSGYGLTEGYEARTIFIHYVR
jgi:DNA repair exonuclease SbcCD ATPase subunit